jgi:PPOX class probable F420-dependent enzyme
MTLQIDTSTAFGERAARRLRDSLVAWLTTVSPDGTPRPVPVWFLYEDDGSVLLYSRPRTPKLRNLEASARAALHLDGNGEGGDIVVLTGTLRRSDDPPAHEVPAYAEKYAGRIARNGWTPESFAGDYSVPLRFEPTRLRGH